MRDTPTWLAKAVSRVYLTTLRSDPRDWGHHGHWPRAPDYRPPCPHILYSNTYHTFCPSIHTHSFRISPILAFLTSFHALITFSFRSRACPHLQESVLANLKSLDTLMSWVQKRKGGREVVRQAIEALQELLLTVLLPNRKLKFLEQQPVQV